MIDGEQRGPFTLEQLPDAGVRPSTYVWCKGMDDWEKAEDVAEICRLYRRRIYDLLHPADPVNPAESDTAGKSDPAKTEVNYFDRSMQGLNLPTIEELDAREDISQPPAKVLPWAILVTLFFFPPIGIFAIYFSVASRRCWKNSQKAPDNGPDALKINGKGLSPTDWRRLAHDYCRAAKMWTGIAFFIGIILISFLIFKL